MTPQKRVFDLVFACAGLLVLAPLFAIVAAAIRIADDGPVFYRQRRVGRDGRAFDIWKFRTMVVDADRAGPLLTAGADPRVTRLGALLRRLKIDELPQLLNVVAGEMSLVGPRPEVARYTSRYTEVQRAVLGYTPGITDPASLQYWDEATLLADARDAELAYVTRVMPEKVRLSIQYARQATLWTDLVVLLQTIQLLPLPRESARATHAGTD